MSPSLGRFSSLYEKYENLIGGELCSHSYITNGADTSIPPPHTHAGTLSQAGLDVVKQELLQLQLASREGGLAHPKLHQLIRIVSGWMKEGRRNRREKVEDQ